MIDICNNKIKFLPILDEDGILVDYFIFESKMSITPISFQILERVMN